MARFEIVKISQKYAQMRTDGRVLSNRAALEMVRLRIQQLAERIDMNEAPERLARLQSLWAEFVDAWDRDKGSETVVLRKKISAEFEAAYHDYAAWQQIFNAIDLDRKLVESEMKVLKEIKAILTVEDAHELVAKLLGIITEEVSDPKTLRRIQYKFVRLIGEQPSDAPKPEVIDVEEEIQD